MVRLKQRYILFEILYPPSDAEKLSYSSSPRDVLLSLHKSSPSSINQKTLTKWIRKVIQDHYGDVGGGTAGMLLQVKYFSNKTSTGIIRCGRLSSNLVVGSLALIDHLAGEDVIVRVTHVSGTIKKCEQYSIQSSRKLMAWMNRGTESIDNLISGFSTISDDEQD